MFDPNQVAQIAAFFARQEPTGLINVMKLVKLMYLADREAIRRFGNPITDDAMVSMPHGPVLSQTLNMINGALSIESAAVWDKWMSDREDYKVGLRRDFSRDDLDHLSDADLEVLADTWKAFGHMDQWQLREYTHQNCPEWQDPNGSSNPIKEEDLLVCLGWSRKDAEFTAQAYRDRRELDRQLSRLARRR